MEICLRDLLLPISVGTVGNFYLRNTSGGVLRFLWCMSLRLSSDGRFLAAVGRRVHSVQVTQESLPSAFTVEMLCPASPSAMGAVKDAQAILHFQPFRFNIYVASALDARE